MVVEQQVYEYICQKCGHLWHTSKKMIIPVCSECNDKHWSKAEDEHWLFYRNYEKEILLKEKENDNRRKT